MREHPNRRFVDFASAGFDPESGAAVLTGGDWYDSQRRYQGANDRVWIYRHGG